MEENIKETVTHYSQEELFNWPRNDLESLSPVRLAATSAHTVALLLDRLEVDECRTVLRQLSNERASDILAEMDEESAADILSVMRESRAVKILDDFEPDDAADIVAELEDVHRNRLMQKLEHGSRKSIENLLTYDPETAGGIMTTEVDTAFDDMTVDEAVVRIRGFADRHEDLHYVYVIDRHRRLKGTVSLRKLIQAKPDQNLASIMRTQINGVCQPDLDKEHVALLMANHNLPDIAVVDEGGLLLGVVTHDDVLDVIQDEFTEDIQKMAGAGGDESIHDEMSYSIRKRQPWLFVNLITALLASSVVMMFEDQIQLLPLLAALMPIIATVGGNSGQQALAVAIRSMALGNLKTADEKMVLFRQTTIGLINGIAIGLLAAVLAFAFGGSLLLSMVVFAAMILNVSLGGLIGALIPIFMRRIGKDPAQCSSIFLTTITDTGGFFILLSLAAWLVL